jgi:hypothetical protein
MGDLQVRWSVFPSKSFIELFDCVFPVPIPFVLQGFGNHKIEKVLKRWESFNYTKKNGSFDSGKYHLDPKNIISAIETLELRPKGNLFTTHYTGSSQDNGMIRQSKDLQ